MSTTSEETDRNEMQKSKDTIDMTKKDTGKKNCKNVP